MLEFEREVSADNKKSKFRMTTGFLLAITGFITSAVAALIKFFFG